MEMMKEKMIAYLQSMMTEYKRREKAFGTDDEYVQKMLDDMIACKEMVEALIQKPVNLQIEGKVTVGF